MDKFYSGMYGDGDLQIKWPELYIDQLIHIVGYFEDEFLRSYVDERYQYYWSERVGELLLKLMYLKKENTSEPVNMQYNPYSINREMSSEVTIGLTIKDVDDIMYIQTVVNIVRDIFIKRSDLRMFGQKLASDMESGDGVNIKMRGMDLEIKVEELNKLSEKFEINGFCAEDLICSGEMDDSVKLCDIIEKSKKYE